jgi:hypothetical protein
MFIIKQTNKQKNKQTNKTKQNKKKTKKTIIMCGKCEIMILTMSGCICFKLVHILVCDLH